MKTLARLLDSVYCFFGWHRQHVSAVRLADGKVHCICWHCGKTWKRL